MRPTMRQLPPEIRFSMVAAGMALLVSACTATPAQPNASSTPSQTPGEQPAPAAPTASPSALPSPRQSRSASPRPGRTAPFRFVDCGAPYGGFPDDNTPPGIRVTLTLERTSYPQQKATKQGPWAGDPTNIRGEVVIENRSGRMTRWWEGYWPRGLARGNGNTWVGGYYNHGTISGGYLGYPFEPGEVKRFPIELDTLQCTDKYEDVREPVPPGVYDAVVSVPIGDTLVVPYDAGSLARVRVTIVGG